MSHPARETTVQEQEQELDRKVVDPTNTHTQRSRPAERTCRGARLLARQRNCNCPFRGEAAHTPRRARRRTYEGLERCVLVYAFPTMGKGEHRLGRFRRPGVARLSS